MTSSDLAKYSVTQSIILSLRQLSFLLSVITWYNVFLSCKLYSAFQPVQIFARTVGKITAMAGNEQGFYYAESANYNPPPGYEFSAPANQFPVDP